MQQVSEMKFETLDDAKTNLINGGFLEAVEYEKINEVAEYMYREEVDTKSAIDALDAWCE